MNKKAVTLVELVMVIAVAGIIGVTLGVYVSTTLDSWALSRTERDIVFSARLALNRMIREIRQVKGVSDINVFNSDEFSFTDINSNSINFKQSGNSLLRNSDELSDKLQNPGGLTFTYLDANGNITAVKNDIRKVRVKLIIESGNSSITIQSQARCMNAA